MIRFMIKKDPPPEKSLLNSSETPTQVPSPDSTPSELVTIDGGTSNASGRPSQVPERLGHYQIVGALGSGGMGIVLKAYDSALKRYAALKMIRTEHPELAIRFVQEARAQARVQHEHVCRVYEVGEMDGKQYIAMQLIDGKTLYLASKSGTFIPKNSYITSSLGNAHARLADYLVSHGKDPTTEFGEARKSLMQSIQIDPSYYQPYSNLGFVESLNAQWLIHQGKSPVAYFDAARKAYLKSIEWNKEEPGTYRSMAEVYRWEADWQIQQKRSPQAAINQGLQWIEKSLKLNKEAPDTIAMQGALLLLQARSESKPAERTRLAVASATALEKAIKMNPFLRNEYEPLLKEA